MKINKDKAIYIAGPMSGMPGWNYHKFFETEARLKSLGYTNVLNPANNSKDPDGHDWTVFMRDAISLIITADAVVFLDGWKESRGARTEMFLAQTLKIPTFDKNLIELAPKNEDITQETICQEADRLVSGDRGNDYGHPIHDFSKTGRMWGAILGDWAKDTGGHEAISPDLVGLCMMALKISREVHKPKRDNRVDMAGYAKCIDMIQSKMSLENIT